MKYALVFALLVCLIGGAYYSGYTIGKSDTKIEYITKEKEVIRYVAKETAVIHSKPNASRSVIIKRMYNGEL